MHLKSFSLLLLAFVTSVLGSAQITIAEGKKPERGNDRYSRDTEGGNNDAFATGIAVIGYRAEIARVTDHDALMTVDGGIVGRTNALQDLYSDGVQNVFKLSFLSPGISYEQRVRRTQTLYVRAYLDPTGYVQYSDALGTSSDVYLDPAVTVQYRFYYNMDRRMAKGKRTQMNSLNYVAPVFKSTFNAESTGYTINRLGVVWGLQRNYSSRFSLDLNVGLGYSFVTGGPGNSTDPFSRPVDELTTIGQLNLGFWLNKRT